MLAELTGEHERLSTENARLKTEQERNKMTTVMSRFMIRKMREKQIAAQVRDASAATTTTSAITSHVSHPAPPPPPRRTRTSGSRARSTGCTSPW